MYVYRGKFDWFEYAVNEAITVVFPTDLILGELVSAFWQWTKDSQGTQKVNTSSNGIIDSVTVAEKKIGFFYDQYYKFDGTVADDSKSLTLVMRKTSGEKSTPFTLQLVYSEPAFVPNCLVYTGKLDWFYYAKNEMITLVVPSPSFSDGNTVCVYWEWTVTSTGLKKANHDWVAPMKISSKTEDGVKQLVIASSYYRFDGEVNGNRDVVTLTMSKPSGEKSNLITLRLANNMMSRKKVRSNNPPQFYTSQIIHFRHSSPATTSASIEASTQFVTCWLTLSALAQGM